VADQEVVPEAAASEAAEIEVIVAVVVAAEDATNITENTNIEKSSV
jgi:hypothetical protein